MSFVKERRIPELLAPAGSLEHLKAAVRAGADAVYMGGEKFSARAYAQNFSSIDMIEALEFAHFHERKLYLTVNTLMKERELADELGDFLLPYYENGLDGVIVQDLGAVRFIRENFPDMEIHGSTQMTVTDYHGAVAAKRMGMTRVVPARELSLSEIKRIKEKTGLEVEVFIHGALCYCYSGQCLFSSMYGGRSGNRGRCAQPCRLPYRLEDSKGTVLNNPKTDKYLLSPRDLCSMSTLPMLMELPVDSLKIEGRMKNVEYVAGVTSVYRSYLDRLSEHWEQRKELYPEAEELHILEELYCRGSFTKGYWKKHNGQDMMSTVSPKNTGRKIGRVTAVFKNKVQIKLEDTVHPKDILVIPVSADRQEELILTVPSKPGKKGVIVLNVPRTQSLRAGMSVYRRKNMELSEYIEKNILDKVIKYPVTGDITLKAGEPLMLELFCKGEYAFVEGPVIELSEKRPVTREDILRQMKKTGNVPFTLTDFEINMEENCFLPMSVLKNVRQQGFALLEEGLKQRTKRQETEHFYPYKEDKEKISASDEVMADNVNSSIHDIALQPERIATVYSREQFMQCCGDSFFDGICLPYEFFAEEVSELAEKAKNKGKKVYFGMPRVFREKEKLERICSMLVWDGIYVYTINEAEFLNQSGCKTEVIAGASLYHWNTKAVEETKDLYPQITVRELPIELSKREVKDMFLALDKEGVKDVSFEVLIYGRVPVMQSAQCLKKTTGRCDQTPEHLYLKDKKGRRLSVTTHCQACYNLIWQAEPRNLIGENLSDCSAGIKRHRFDLFALKTEDIEEKKQAYLSWRKGSFAEVIDEREKDHYWNYGIE